MESDDRMTEAEERAVRALVFLFFVRSCCLFVCWLVGLVFVVTVVVAAAAVVVAVVVVVIVVVFFRSACLFVFCCCYCCSCS